MNFYLRLLLILLRRKYQKITGFDVTSSYFFHVVPTDIDALGHMNNGRYLTYADLGRLHFLTGTRAYEVFQKNGWIGILGHTKATYLKPLFMFNKVELRTRLFDYDEKWVEFEQLFVRNEKIHAKINVKIVLKKVV